jgi:hypothetical protein
MAIIKLSSPISGIRGEVGGLVYSANKAGPYLKTWARGTNPRSFAQTNHRSNLVILSTSWRNLSPTQKNNWVNYANDVSNELFNSLGEGYFISGHNWFIRINLNRFSFGEGIRQNSPAIGVPASPIVDTVQAVSTANPAGTFIRLAIGSPGLGQRCAVKAIMVNSIGRLVQAQVKTFMITTQQSAALRAFQFKPELLAKFGTAQIGQVVFATIQHQNSEGRRSPAVAGRGSITS